VFPIRDLNPTRITPVVTIALIAINVLVFLLWQPHLNEAAGEEFAYRHAAIACEVTQGQPISVAEFQSDRCIASSGAPIFPDKQPYAALFVSMFLHAGIAHILGNMWFLWLFGTNIEEAFGTLRYAAFYLIGGMVAALAFVAVHPSSVVPLVGASGAIAAVLGAYLVLFPGKLVLSWAFITLIPVPAVIFLGLWFVGQFAVGDAGVAWESHVAGFVFGALVTLVFRGSLLRRIRGAQGPQWGGSY